MRTFFRFARASFRKREKSEAPARKVSYILDPVNAPKTIRRNRDYPPDFHLYVFAGPMIEQVRCIDNEGKETRCPALVARMVRQTEFTQGVMMGAKSLEEMTCSVRDLRTYKDAEKDITGHPDTDRIEKALADFYASKVASKQRDGGIKETDFIHLTAHVHFHADEPRRGAVRDRDRSA